jgi:phospholipid/cholesterol/gamma-HCH transport system substrate-binding protein
VRRSPRAGTGRGGSVKTEQGEVDERGSTTVRIVSLLALVAAFTVAALMLFGGSSSGHSYRLLFETAGQLVEGNQVLIGGRPVGAIDSIDLTEDNQAEVEITTEDPLPEGSTATIRLTSLSGVANRYVSIFPGPGPEMLGEGTTVTTERTTTPVDLDQLFNVFKDRERKALSQVIRGSGEIYDGVGKQANRTHKFLNPGLSSTERLFAELNSDEMALERFMIEGSRAMGAIADRRDDLAALVGNASESLGAIATENESLERTLVALPPTMRQANTTFVNLRATLDDLDPLVADAKPATRNLAQFLRDTRPVVRKGVPVFANLADVVAPNGTQQILRDLPVVRKRANRAVPRAIEALDDFQPVLSFARPYTPDVLGWLTKFGQATAYYDAHGHYARAMPAGANIFDYDEASERLQPIFEEREKQYDFFKSTPNALGTFLRCPGAATQPNAGWPTPTDHPFLDDGRLGADDCDPSDVPPGLPATR